MAEGVDYQRKNDVVRYVASRRSWHQWAKVPATEELRSFHMSRYRREIERLERIYPDIRGNYDREADTPHPDDWI